MTQPKRPLGYKLALESTRVLSGRLLASREQRFVCRIVKSAVTRVVYRHQLGVNV